MIFSLPGPPDRLHPGTISHSGLTAVIHVVHNKQKAALVFKKRGFLLCSTHLKDNNNSVTVRFTVKIIGLILVSAALDWI